MNQQQKPSGCSRAPAPGFRLRQEHIERPASPAVSEGQESVGTKDEMKNAMQSCRPRVRLDRPWFAAAGIKTAPATTQSCPATVDPDRRDCRRPGSRGAYHRTHFWSNRRGSLQRGRPRTGWSVAHVVLESADISRTRAELRSGQSARTSRAQNATRLEALSLRLGTLGKRSPRHRQAAALAASAAASCSAPSAAAGAKEGRTRPRSIGGARSDCGSILQRNAIQGQTVEVGHLFADSGRPTDRVLCRATLREAPGRVQVGAKADVRPNAYLVTCSQARSERIGQQLDPLGAHRRRAHRHPEPQTSYSRWVYLARRGSQCPTAPRSGPSLWSARRCGSIAQDDVAFVRQPDGHFEIHPPARTRCCGSGRGHQRPASRRAGGGAGAFSLKSIFLKTPSARRSDMRLLSAIVHWSLQNRPIVIL